MFCNLSVSTFPIHSLSITFICLSPWISAKHFTVSRLPNASNAVTFGLGLQITVDYIFYGEYRFIEWFKKPIDKLDKKSMLTKAEKYMK